MGWNVPHMQTSSLGTQWCKNHQSLTLYAFYMKFQNVSQLIPNWNLKLIEKFNCLVLGVNVFELCMILGSKMFDAQS